jgi:hypothetical protein
VTLGSLDPEIVETRLRLLSALATAHLEEGKSMSLSHRLDALALADSQQVTTNFQDVRRLRVDLEPSATGRRQGSWTSGSPPSADRLWRRAWGSMLTWSLT